jgi:hypothetical protein
LFSLYVVDTVVTFYLGYRYGAKVKAEAVAVSLAAFTRAKAALARFVQYEHVRVTERLSQLEDLKAKYL